MFLGRLSEAVIAADDQQGEARGACRCDERMMTRHGRTSA
jgi:hypothetical protein